LVRISIVRNEADIAVISKPSLTNFLCYGNEISFCLWK